MVLIADKVVGLLNAHTEFRVASQLVEDVTKSEIDIVQVSRVNDKVIELNLVRSDN